MSIIRKKCDLFDLASDLLGEHDDAQSVKDAFEDGGFLETIEWDDSISEKQKQEWVEDVHWSL